jgi:uncharacterized repeat protein (TIGR01451 family)
MTRAAATLRWLALIAILVGLLSPIGTVQVSAQDQGGAEASIDGTPTPPDGDSDGVSDDVDNCLTIPNADQVDTDGDGAGDACESDGDGDGIVDDIDNCPAVANVDQANTYGDALGDACEAPPPPPDFDGDGVSDDVDNCPNTANPDQTDSDLDGAGDACDSAEESETDAPPIDDPTPTSDIEKGGDEGDEEEESQPRESAAEPDMAVNVVPDAPVVSSGDPVGFTIIGMNIGAGQALGATLTAELPGDLSWTIDGPPTIASSTNEDPAASMAQGFSAAQIECVPTGNVIDCVFADMDPGISITFHVTATSDPESCSTLETSAGVAATNEPSDALANNGFASPITVACPQVSVNKVADAETVNSGEKIGFTISVANQIGEGEAVGVALTDTLPTIPAGLNWTIDGGSNASNCGIAAGELTCDFGSLLDGDIVTVHISSPTVENETCGVVTNAAVVNAINEQPEDLADNESTDSVQVGCVKGTGPEPGPKPGPKVDVVETVTVGDVDTPITGLPSAGQGEIAGMGGPSWLLILGLTIMFAGTAYAVRRCRIA